MIQGEALPALQANTAFLTATVGRLVIAALSYVALRQAISSTGDQVVTAVLSDLGIPDGLAAVAGRVTDAAVSSLLQDPAVWIFASSLAVTLIGGGDVVGPAIRAVITSAPLRAALGTAVGRGLGTLFGDNIVGTAVSLVTAGAVTQLLGLISGIGSLFLAPEPAGDSASAQRLAVVSAPAPPAVQPRAPSGRGPGRLSALAA